MSGMSRDRYGNVHLRIGITPKTVEQQAVRLGAYGLVKRGL